MCYYRRFLRLVLTAPILGSFVGCAANGPSGSSSPLALQSAFDATKAAPAIHITTEIDKGEGTPVTESWDVWAAAGLGYRANHPSQTEVFDEQKKRLCRMGPRGMSGEILYGYETCMSSEFLRRGRQEESIEYLIAQEKCGNPSFQKQEIDVNGTIIHKITCNDELSRPIAVEFDPLSRHILRTESWIRPNKESGIESTRIVTRYEYPQIGKLDPKLFEIPEPNPRTGIKVVNPDETAMQACLSNLRDVVGLMMKYEEHHQEGLPSDLEKAIRSEEGFRESMLHCPLMPANGKLQYASELKPGTKSFVEIPFDTVIFECRNHKGRVVQVYGGGHAMAKNAE